jgi:hypothetical protein
VRLGTVTNVVNSFALVLNSFISLRVMFRRIWCFYFAASRMAIE